MDFPFRTDGCSGGMSRGWRKLIGGAPPWERVCVRHDVRYWAGGTWPDKLRADLIMLWEVTTSSRWLAPLLLPVALCMFLAVTVAGGPRWRTGYRWAYGWRFERRRGYAPLPGKDAAQRDMNLVYRAAPVRPLDRIAAAAIAAAVWIVLIVLWRW